RVGAGRAVPSRGIDRLERDWTVNGTVLRSSTWRRTAAGASAAVRPSRRAVLRASGALLAPWLLAPLAAPSDAAARFDVRALGAKGDGAGPDTRAVQAAIDAAGRSGGTVYFPPGRYVSGTLRLRSRVTLLFDADATLVASSRDKDFDPVEPLPYQAFADRETTDFRFALLQGHGLRDLSILGPGRIDGRRSSRGGPKLVALKQCRDVRIRDVTLVDAPNYAVS